MAEHVAAVTGGAPWHVRVHRIETGRAITAVETGFALQWEPAGFLPAAGPDMDGLAVATSPWGSSVLIERTPAHSGVEREVGTLHPGSNANMMAPHTVMPSLTATLTPGVHLIACAAGVSPDVEAVAHGPAPDVSPELLAALDAFAAREVDAVEDGPNLIDKIAEELLANDE